MSLNPGLKSSEFWMNVLSAVPLVLGALAQIPIPPVALSAVALSALYTLVRTFLKSKQFDIQAAADVATKAQAAVAAIEAAKAPAAPAAAPAFDASVFPGMTASEQTAAKEVTDPAALQKLQDQFNAFIAAQAAQPAPAAAPAGTVKP